MTLSGASCYVSAAEGIDDFELVIVQEQSDPLLQVFRDAVDRFGNASADGSGGVAVAAHGHAVAYCILVVL